MTAKTAIVIGDNSLTPEGGTPGITNRTFNPGELEKGIVHTFYNTNTGYTPAAMSKLTVSLVPGNQVYRFRATTALPYASVVNGVLTVMHITRAATEFLLPINGSRDDRRDCKSLHANFLNDTGVHAMVSDLENLY